MEVIAGFIKERVRTPGMYQHFKQILGAAILAVSVAMLFMYVMRCKDVMEGRASVSNYVSYGNNIDITHSLEEFINSKERFDYLNVVLINKIDVTAKETDPMGKGAKAETEKISVKESEGDNARNKDREMSIGNKGNTDSQSHIDHQADTDHKVSTDPIVTEEDKNMDKESGNVEIEGSRPAVPDILSIELYGNGGIPEVITDSCKVSDFSVGKYEEPKRMGKIFDGWFADQGCTVPFEMVEEGADSLKLFAGWREFPGFTANDKGYITGYTEPSKFLRGTVVRLPFYDTCIGIEKNALKGLENKIEEIYIPANITYIEDGAFDYLYNLIYIEVASQNKEFYSKNGILYDRNGKELAVPSMLKTK